MEASTILTEAAQLLLDTDHTYWPEAELIGYLDEAQGLIAEYKPDAVAVTEDHQLEAGPRQTLPVDGFLLFDVVRNRGLSGIDKGPAITSVDMRHMDRMLPDWQTVESRVVEHYMADGREPREFYVYPAQPIVAGIVEIRYARRPSLIEDSDDELTVRAEYRPALVDYLLYRAHSKDTTAAVPARAQAHYQQFRTHLGLSNQTAQATRAGERDQGGLR